MGADPGVGGKASSNQCNGRRWRVLPFAVRIVAERRRREDREGQKRGKQENPVETGKDGCHGARLPAGTDQAQVQTGSTSVISLSFRSISSRMTGCQDISRWLRGT